MAVHADSCPFLCFAGEFDFPDSNSLDLSGEGINGPTMGWLEGGHVLTRELGGPVLGQAGPFCGCVIFGGEHRSFWEHRSLEAILWTPTTDPLDSMTPDSLELPQVQRLFSNFHRDHSHLGGSLRLGFLPAPQSLCFSGLGVGPENVHFQPVFPVMLMGPSGKGAQFGNQCPKILCSYEIAGAK